MPDSGYVNDVFLKWFEHFQKHRSLGKCILILDGHSYHCSLQCLEHCRQNGIEKLCLPPHTTHALQPLERSVFQSLEVFYHHAATNYIHSTPGSAVYKFNFRELFSTAYNKAATIGYSVKEFKCTGLFSLNLLVISVDKFLPSVHYQADISNVPSCLLPEIPTYSQLWPKPLC
ncbi:uncharacterized protein LOC126176556 [Schistocerca cancellata]|uniref:uncharacterized protein LOC126176556 n=1 Tax=Schistocerca cancellata TaxID=274614 RepID=UPI002117CD31|nr:uncharacterized protein LOC126176556 [Schistocerca cancellata]